MAPAKRDRCWAREPGSAAEVYFYDSEDRLQTRRGSTIVETVLHGPGIDDYIGARDSDGTVRYMLTDGLGSVTERTSRAGSLTWRAEYEPFGAASAVFDPGGIGAGGYGYTGRVNDPDTGLMYYRSRYYSPEMRRFTQDDRWDGILEMPETFITKYVYVNNNPISRIDPSGYSSFSIVQTDSFATLEARRITDGLYDEWYCQRGRDFRGCPTHS